MRYLFLIVVVVGVTSCGKKPSTKSEDTPPPPPVTPMTASNQKTDPVVTTTGSQGKKMSDEEATKKTSDPKVKEPEKKGTDSVAAQNKRWVLRFKVESGKDYLEQLKAMKAELLFPTATNDKTILITDLSKLDERRETTDDEMKRLAKKLFFSDSRTEAVNAVCKTLGMEKDIPKMFWAFFPEEISKACASKELAYKNRKVEDIKETIFKVVVKDGKYELTVIEQKSK
jgi:hypothetical protein